MLLKAPPHSPKREREVQLDRVEVKPKQDPKENKPNTKKKDAKQSKAKCSTMTLPGHYKYNCPNYLGELTEKKRQNSEFDLHFQKLC